MPKKTRISFWRRANQFPPYVVRLLARDDKALLSNAEIGRRCGVSEFEVASMSREKSWDAIPLGLVRKFLVACRCDFEDHADMKRVTTYLKGKKRNGARIPPQYNYLRQSPEWASFYEPLIRSTQAKRQ